MDSQTYKDFYYQSFGYIPYREYEARENYKKKVCEETNFVLIDEIQLEKERIKLEILKAKDESEAVALYERIKSFEDTYNCITTATYLRQYLRKHLFYKE